MADDGLRGATVRGNGPHVAALRRHALALPEAVEEFPWGERAFKVRRKVFAFVWAGDDGGLRLTVKLPVSAEMALTLPFVAPTGYGLGRSGWVTASFGPDDEPPLAMLCEWIDQSFRAVAPKRLAATLDR
ncbi:MAG: MmcQ/YjbR family DNA-binding protein [Alphaproteobacteria bacterium]